MSKKPMCVLAKLLQSCPTLWDSMGCNQAPLSMDSPGKYWSGLPYPPSGHLPDPGIKPTSLTSPALAAKFFMISATWEAQETVYIP